MSYGLRFSIRTEYNSSTTTAISTSAMSFEAAEVFDLEDVQEVPHTVVTPVPEIPFRLMDLNVSIRQRILRMVLVKGGHMVPHYNQFSYRGLAHEVEGENVDLAVLRVCKSLTEEALPILYGENLFLFKTSEKARWWLEHIGDDNRLRLRRAAFSLTGGEQGQFGTLKEVLWGRFFFWLSSNQLLDEIWLDFRGWQNFDEFPDHDLNEFQLERAVNARNGTIHLLQQFRGFRKVMIVKGWTLGSLEVADLIAPMKLPRAA